MRKFRNSVRSAALATMVGLALSSHAQAHESTAANFEMAVFVDAPSGAAVRRGHYHEAIERLSTARARLGDRIANVSNLCVAYTFVEDFTAAIATCYDAVELSRNALSRSQKLRRSSSHRAARRELAVALSNLGVLKALTGELADARAHINEAVLLRSSLREPTRNLRKLEQLNVQSISSL